MTRTIRYLVATLALVAVEAHAQSQEIVLHAGNLLNCTLAEPDFSSRSAAIGEPVTCYAYPLREFGYSVFPWGSYLTRRFVDYRDPGLGDPSWFRLTELWTPSAKSVFRFGVQGQVATSTHAGLPWLRYLRTNCRERVHFWPFDGLEVPAGRSVVAEVYPSLWTRRFANNGERNADQHAAYAAASWLQGVDMNGSLERYFNPPLKPEERTGAQIEGWILGVL